MAGGTRPWIERLWRVFGDGVTHMGSYVPSRKSVRIIPDNESLFGEQLFAERRTTIAVNSAYGISRLRQTDNGTGSSYSDDTQLGKIIIGTGTTSGSSRRLSLAEVGLYEPGHDAEVGIGIRTQEVFEGTAFARWGGLSAPGNDGFYFKRVNGNAVSAVRLKGGTEVETVSRDNWNLDTFDGSGDANNPSGINLNLQNGYIYQVDFTWYGYGVIAFGIVRAIPANPEKQRFIPGHVMQINGDISINEPNLQVFAEIDNGDQATDYQLEVGGMQYAVLGPKGGQRSRKVDDFVESVSVPGDNSYVHLISFQRKTTFLNRSVSIDELELIASGERLIFELWVFGTITGGTWTTPPGYTASETSVESKVQSAGDPTSFDETNAVLIDRYIVDSNKNQSGEPNTPIVDIDLPNEATFTLTVRNNTGSSGTVSLAQMKLTEGW